MANDFKSLWRKEVEKLNRQIHKYEKEGVRFVYRAMDEEETPKKTYTQADVDLIKAKRLTIFEGATLYDTETGKLYKGKEEITQRVRQRNQHQKQMVDQHKTQLEVEKEIKQNKKEFKNIEDKNVADKKYIKESRPSQKIASLSDSIAHQLIEIATTFDPVSAFPLMSDDYHKRKKEQADTFLNVVLKCLNTKGFAAYIDPYWELTYDMQKLLYDSLEFSNTPRTMAFIDKLMEFARKAEIMSDKEIENFYKQYGVEQYESEGDIF